MKSSNFSEEYVKSQISQNKKSSIDSTENVSVDYLPQSHNSFEEFLKETRKKSEIPNDFDTHLENDLTLTNFVPFLTSSKFKNKFSSYSKGKNK